MVEGAPRRAGGGVGLKNRRLGYRPTALALDEAHVQALRSASQVGDAQGPRIDLAHTRFDLLIGQQRVVDALALEVAVAHDFAAAEHFGVERSLKVSTSGLFLSITIEGTVRAMLGIDAQVVRRRLYAMLPEQIARPLARAERPAAFARWDRLRANPRAPYSFRPFDELDCVFVHTPRTGGVSVSTALFGWNAGGHETLLDYTWIYGRDELARRFSFAFVRNPWDRLYSAWRFLRAGGTEPGDRKFADQHLAGYRDFSDWVARWLTPDRARAFVHLVPQHLYVSLAGDRRDVDFLGRFEYLADDFASLAHLLGVERSLAHLNRAPGPTSNYRAAYTDEARAIAANVYAQDIDWFGYRW